jgi:quinoprotein glucose dehydrogenase
MRMRVLACLVAVVFLAASISGQKPGPAGEWRSYASDPMATKYSLLDQINKDNVKDLRIAWRWSPDNFGPARDYNWQATPIVVNGVLYVTAGSRRDVVAIDGSTGETLWMWRYDEGRRAQLAPNRARSGRGLAYWTDGAGDERIIVVTAGYRLAALDAKTGHAIKGFGVNGLVDLYEGLDQEPPKDGQIAVTSPPTIVNDVVVVGAALAGTGPNDPRYLGGFPRGFDVRTGRKLWTFHTIPRPGEYGNETWERDSWSYTGNTGVWAPMSADPELGYVYLPVETPTSDYYGGGRPGNGLFGETLLCLDAKTGKRVWHFQLVHHGVWDYDPPTAPILGDITVGGRRIKAVVQVTKQAFAYVFDRTNGEPVWPIVERPVPQSDIPGEKTSPTQPFPTKPAAFDRQGVTLDDLIDFTPALKAEGEKIASEYKLGPLFTPPIVAGTNGKKATMIVPGSLGGANWPGGAFDKETGVLYVASISSQMLQGLALDPKRNATMAYGAASRPASAASPDAQVDPGVAAASGGGSYGPSRAEVFGPQGLPILKPPYGRITAIDLNTGDHLWQVPNAETPDYIVNHPALKGVTIPRTGRPSHSAIIVTKTLVFAGEGSELAAGLPFGAGGPMFRAYDKQTGAIVWEFKLPAPQTGVAMTYAVDGRQYIAVPVGGRKAAAELVVLSLP